MSIDWGQILQWFISSVLGASLVKGVDYWLGKRKDSARRREAKVETLLGYIRMYGELTQLYRFRAYLSMTVRQNAEGEIIVGDDGKPVVDRIVLETEPRFEEAIKELTGADLNSAITTKIASIRLAAAEAHDLALELDPSGDLKKDLSELYMNTINGIESVLRHKDSVDPGQAVSQMMDALTRADQSRHDIRSKIGEYVA